MKIITVIIRRGSVGMRVVGMCVIVSVWICGDGVVERGVVEGGSVVGGVAVVGARSVCEIIVVGCDGVLRVLRERRLDADRGIGSGVD